MHCCKRICRDTRVIKPSSIQFVCTRNLCILSNSAIMPYPIDMIHCRNSGDRYMSRMLLLFLVIIAANSSLAEDLPGQSVFMHPVQMSHRPRIDIPLIGRVTNDSRLYYLDASIGSPQQKLKLVVDTGSTDTWVYGPKLCKPNGQEIPPYQCCTLCYSRT